MTSDRSLSTITMVKNMVLVAILHLEVYVFSTASATGLLSFSLWLVRESKIIIIILIIIIINTYNNNKTNNSSQTFGSDT